MPSQQTAKPDMIRVEVLTAIGIDATPEMIKEQQQRADRKGIKFQSDGLTTMIYPERPKKSEDGKTVIPPQPVYVELERSVAKKLSEAGKVRVAL